MADLPRIVVVLCGPAGSGKTTAALKSGLTVYDRDQPQWTSEQHFTQHLAALARNPTARAVVIRSGATSSARNKAMWTVGGTHLFLMPALTQRELTHRIGARNRADRAQGIASVGKWFKDFDDRDEAPTFPGWHIVETPRIGPTSRHW